MSLRAGTVVACLLLGSVIPAYANLMIQATFDPTITSDPNATAIENTINSAIAVYESDFSNNITVNIYYQEGPGLGETNAIVYEGPYSVFDTALTITDANPAAVSALNANGGSGTDNPVTGTSGIEIKSANARAVGIFIPPGCQLASGSAYGVPYVCGGNSGTAYDAIITLDTATTNPGGNSGQYSLLAAVEHETDEALGLGSALLNCAPFEPGASAACAADNLVDASNNTIDGNPQPEDLFRYDSSGNRTLSNICFSSTVANFSYGPSTGVISPFNNFCNGGDFGDWATTATPQVQDAFATSGANPTLDMNEIDALSAIGYIPTAEAFTVPEPASFFMALGAIGLFWLRARRRA